MKYIKTEAMWCKEHKTCFFGKCYLCTKVTERDMEEKTYKTLGEYGRSYTIHMANRRKKYWEPLYRRIK